MPPCSAPGGKEQQGGIRKQGDGYLRRLLVVGPTAVIRLVRKENARKVWATKPLERQPARLVSVALANKTARIAWAVMTGLTHEELEVEYDAGFSSCESSSSLKGIAVAKPMSAVAEQARYQSDLMRKPWQ